MVNIQYRPVTDAKEATYTALILYRDYRYMKGENDI